MANTLNVVKKKVVEMSVTDAEAFYTASKSAKAVGSERECGFAVVVRYEGGFSRRVWVAYSNGVWTNCVDCCCLDEAMETDFVLYVRNRAENSNLNLGYND